MKPNELRSKLKKYMAVQELTVTDVAARTHMSVTTVSRFVSGETEKPHQLAVDAFLSLLSNKSNEIEKL
jgi:transcriptional regulator with XRE-family HTH domain